MTSYINFFFTIIRNYFINWSKLYSKHKDNTLNLAQNITFKSWRQSTLCQETIILITQRYENRIISLYFTAVVVRDFIRKLDSFYWHYSIGFCYWFNEYKVIW
jgi:hypothetical protein